LFKWKVFRAILLMYSGHRNRDRNNQEVIHNLHSPSTVWRHTVYGTRIRTERPTVTHLEEQELGFSLSPNLQFL